MKKRQVSESSRNNKKRKKEGRWEKYQGKYSGRRKRIGKGFPLQGQVLVWQPGAVKDGADEKKDYSVGRQVLEGEKLHEIHDFSLPENQKKRRKKDTKREREREREEQQTTAAGC